MQTKLYELVKKILTDYPATRDSDKHLIWEVWNKLDLLLNDRYDMYWSITRDNFLKAPAEESITRARRLIQARHPKLRASQKVQEYRAAKEKTKSLFVYHEKVQDISMPVASWESLKEKLIENGTWDKIKK